MWSVVSVLVTAGLGSWLAYLWQQRGIKASRYFDASKARYDQMRSAADDLATLIGKRLYAMQRLSLTTGLDADLDAKRDDLRLLVIEWNRQYLQIELNIRTLFRYSAVSELEYLQSDLRRLTSRVLTRTGNSDRRDTIDWTLTQDINVLRGTYFRFLQGMLDEADSLFRQMHFGVKLKYDRSQIEYFSTWQLVKAIFTGPDEASSVVRSPTDFGLPVDAGDARLGIH